MSSDAMPMHADALLEHQEFVRSLARSLLRDEHAAQDVAQETLLTLLTHPPRTIESMRGWLAQVTKNRARSVAREGLRRDRREKAASRAEVDESDAKMHERLALQHRVVEAVLSLREPYKSVVMLSYYEGLSPTEIAKRRDVPAGTVRAQLSRALQMLREKLDTECEGGRSAWSVGLVAILSRSNPLAIGTKLATTTKILAASVLIVGVAVPLAWWWILSVPRGVIRTDGWGYIIPEATESSSPPEPSDVDTTSKSVSRSPIFARVPAAIETRPLPTELDAMFNEGVQIQLLLRSRLLTPDRAVVEARRDLAALPGTQFARLWRRGALGTDNNNLVGMRGAGAFLSFATGVQSYDFEPDLALDAHFRSGFYGGSVGAVVRLEGVLLADVLNERSPCSGTVDLETWNALWADSKMDEHSIPAAFDARIRHLAQSAISNSSSAPVLGGTYLVRSLSTREHDLVGAFEVIARDEQSVTIAWRVLKRWEISRPRARTGVDPLAGVAPSPGPLILLSTDELIARREALSAHAAKKILDIPEDLDPAFARYAAQRDGGLARITQRSRWDSLLSIDGGGAYWSFTQRSNDYQKDAQIELQQGRFSSGFAGGDRGYVMDVGEIPLEQVSVRGRSPALDEHGEESAAFMWSLVPLPVSADGQELEIGPQDQARARELGLDRGADAVDGHSYLVRAVQPGRQDVLAAFQVLARDDGGLTLAWKILRQQPASR